MSKRTAAAFAAAIVLSSGGTGAALAANGADDPAGHHPRHHIGDDHKAKHRDPGRYHHQGSHGADGDEPGDDHGGLSDD